MLIENKNNSVKNKGNYTYLGLIRSQSGKTQTYAILKMFFVALQNGGCIYGIKPQSCWKLYHLLVGNYDWC
jgi:hypothetical protein